MILVSFSSTEDVLCTPGAGVRYVYDGLVRYVRVLCIHVITTHLLGIKASKIIADTPGADIDIGRTGAYRDEVMEVS